MFFLLLSSSSFRFLLLISFLFLNHGSSNIRIDGMSFIQDSRPKFKLDDLPYDIKIVIADEIRSWSEKLNRHQDRVGTKGRR